MKALGGVLGAALILVAAVAHGKATVVIVNADSADAGFNDPTPVSPIGGNCGTTLGAHRLVVFQRAAAIWGNALESAAPIAVLSHFQPLSCTSAETISGGRDQPGNNPAEDRQFHALVDASRAGSRPRSPQWPLSDLTGTDSRSRRRPRRYVVVSRGERRAGTLPHSTSQRTVSDIVRRNGMGSMPNSVRAAESSSLVSRRRISIPSRSAG